MANGVIIPNDIGYEVNINDVFTLSTSIATMSGLSFAKRCGSVVELNIYVASTSTGSYGDIGVLKAPYNPGREYYFAAMDSTDKKAVPIGVFTNGTLRIYGYTSGHNYQVYMTYIIP